MPRFSSMGKRKKNKIFERLKIERIGAKGRGIAQAPDGRVVFVPYTAPGDVVDVQIRKKRKNYYEGIAIGFHAYSNLRTEPVCDYFGLCGGCQLQHIDYEKQLEIKGINVKENILRIGKVQPGEVLPVLASPKIYAYRNKMEYAFTSRRWLTEREIKSGEDFDRRGAGFHIPGHWDKILDIEHCHLQPEPGNRIRNELRDFAKRENISFYDPLTREGLLRQLTVRVMKSGEIMVLVHFAREEKENIDKILRHLTEIFPGITSLNYVINPKPNDSIYDLEVLLYYGKPYVTEQIDGLKFRIKPKSFFQTNSWQTENLYRKVMEYARIRPGDTVYDLYSGTGTMSLLAARHAGKVIGLETVDQAVEDARENARLNGIRNVFFEQGDVKHLFTDALISRHGMPDILITDPPREGMHREVVEQILQVRPKRIVYVSCNAATQARDIALMKNFYELRSIQPVDMFPQTYHAENIAVLELKT